MNLSKRNLSRLPSVALFVFFCATIVQAKLCTSVLSEEARAEIAEKLSTQTSLNEDQAEAVIALYDYTISKQASEDPDYKTPQKGWPSLKRIQKHYFRKYNKVTLLNAPNGRTVILVGDKFISDPTDSTLLDGIIESTPLRAAQDYIPTHPSRQNNPIIKVLKAMATYMSPTWVGAKNISIRHRHWNQFDTFDLNEIHGREFEEFSSRLGEFLFIGTSLAHTYGWGTNTLETLLFHGLDYWPPHLLANQHTLVAGASYIAASVLFKTLPKFVKENPEVINKLFRTDQEAQTRLERKLIVGLFNYINNALESDPTQSTDTLIKKSIRWFNSFMVDFSNLFNFNGPPFEERLKSLFPNSHGLENRQIAKIISEALQRKKDPKSQKDISDVLVAVVHNNGSLFRPATWNTVVELLTGPEYGFKEISLDYEP